MYSRLLAITLASALTIFTAALPAAAQFTGRVSSGNTDLLFTTEFSNTLGGLGIGTALASPARKRRGLISIPIRNGQLDTITARSITKSTTHCLMEL